MLVLAETYRRSTLRFVTTVLKPWLIPCSRPNSRNATTIDSIVKIVRARLRHSPAQIEGEILHAARLARLVDQPALVEVQLARRVLGRLRIVRHHDDRLALRAIQRLQQVHDLLGAAPVEIARRLVAHQQRRIRDQRARDRDALLLTAGQLVRLVLAAIGQTDQLQRRLARACGAALRDRLVSSSGTSTFASAVSTGSRL